MNNNNYNIEIGKSLNGLPLSLNLKYLNRHAFVGGATGSGKTTTVKKIIEELYNNDVPMLVFDAKGDLSALANHYNIDLVDYYGVNGRNENIELDSLRAEELSNILNLATAQKDVFSICLLYADDHNYKIKTIKDLNNVMIHIIKLLENKEDFSKYGYLDIRSIKTLLRKIKILEHQGDSAVFGVSGFNFIDTIDRNITVINSLRLTQAPKLYASVINKALNEMYYNLPEVGDLEKPKIAIFIDEAHLLFNNAPKSIVKELEQIIKLIRSKGVAIFFISQLHTDISADVYSQLSLKIQHRINIATEQDIKHLRALTRAYSNDLKEVKELEQVIKDLRIGQVIAIQQTEQGIKRDVYQIAIPKVITSKVIEIEELNKHLALNNDIQTITSDLTEIKDKRVLNYSNNIKLTRSDLKGIIKGIIIIAIILAIYGQ